MSYEIEYYAHGPDDRQPAEDFEDRLMRHSPKLCGKLMGVAKHVADTLPGRVGGGLLEKCRDFPDLWEVRTIFGNELARFVVGKDGSGEPPRLVLLEGFWKQPGQETPRAPLERAGDHWKDYLKTGQVSPGEASDVEV